MYRLHAIPDFASLIVHLVLAELDAPYQLVWRDIDKGDLQTPEYLAIHPFGKIPAMETPDGPMFETGAILLYLSEKHARLAPKMGDPARAAFLSWFVFTNHNLHTNMMQLIHPYRPGGEDAKAMILPVAHATLRDQYATLEAMLQRDRPHWLSPDAPSILSLYLAVIMRWTSVFAHEPAFNIPVVDYPALHAIMASLESRPAVQRVAAIEGIGPTPFTKAS
ncbi:MAG: glutathione S-transferase family protein [Rhodobacteraceae bacterium]|jgi:glutathione S-transferase|nr:glutathione S-transferase family protein [Paracoccaceae bacterium]